MEYTEIKWMYGIYKKYISLVLKSLCIYFLFGPKLFILQLLCG